MLSFYFVEKDLGIVLHHVAFMISQDKYFACYTLLTDQISLSDFIVSVSVLQSFVSQVDIINFEINLILLIKPFFCMTKKSRLKFKYPVNKASF